MCCVAAGPFQNGLLPGGDGPGGQVQEIRLPSLTLSTVKLCEGRWRALKSKTGGAGCTYVGGTSSVSRNLRATDVPRCLTCTSRISTAASCKDSRRRRAAFGFAPQMDILQLRTMLEKLDFAPWCLWCGLPELHVVLRARADTGLLILFTIMALATGGKDGIKQGVFCPLGPAPSFHHFGNTRWASVSIWCDTVRCACGTRETHAGKPVAGPGSQSKARGLSISRQSCGQ